MIEQKIYDLLTRYKKHTNNFLYNEKIKDDFELLEPGIDVSKKQKEFVLEKIRLCVFIAALGGLLTGSLWIKERNAEHIGDNRIQREEYGGGSKQVRLKARQDEKDIEVNFVLDEKEFLETELEKEYEEFLPVLKKKMLGENVSFDLVSYDLCLCDEIENYPFLIEWSVDGEYVAGDGRLLEEELEEPQIVEITAKISYRNFYRREEFVLCIYSKAVKQSIEEKLSKQMEQLEENSRNEKEFVLPDQYNGKAIIWKNEVKHYAIWGVIGIPFLLVVLMLCKDRDLHQKVDERQEQMTFDYPEIVSKLSLYIGAGMTTQRAWIKIAREYERKRKKRHYAYEEMMICVRDMENGTPVGAAFEKFGKRCRHADYMKMATLLSQHIKKGTTNISKELMAEANWAYEERKQEVRKKGEKAGTKLLVPMMMLLFIIMVMILVPAFFNQF